MKNVNFRERGPSRARTYTTTQVFRNPSLVSNESRFTVAHLEVWHLQSEAEALLEPPPWFTFLDFFVEYEGVYVWQPKP